jgi:uncharacterized protein with LGFP repeats
VTSRLSESEDAIGAVSTIPIMGLASASKIGLGSAASFWRRAGWGMDAALRRLATSASPGLPAEVAEQATGRHKIWQDTTKSALLTASGRRSRFAGQHKTAVMAQRWSEQMGPDRGAS